MSVAAFVKNIEAVENLGNDTFRVSLLILMMDAANSTFIVSFDSSKGSDWRLAARTAVADHALSDYGEEVGFLILPSLETI